MDITQIYDELVADHFDEDLFEIHQDSRAQALGQIQRQGRQGALHILDLGMGTGAGLLQLAEVFPQAKFHGVELSQKMIATAERKFAEKNQQVHVIHEDANRFGVHITSAQMDLIIIHFVLNYVDRPRLMTEAFRCLKPGGLFSVASSTHQCFAGLHGIAAQFVPPEQINAQRLIPEDIDELEADLKQAGFQVAEKQLFRKPVTFEDFDHFYHFAMHSGWLADPLFLQHMSREKIGIYREFAKSLFPFQDVFEAAIVLAEKA
ncbi:MAG TPA: hypothetical protein DF383_00680 [Deltaproteobacteria bacterium]|nr:hypothetical protein [Deltaproteobacteria bacterium]